MASMRDIKRRKSSIQGTQQITRAMKLVSTVKLQRAREHAERSKSYFDCMYSTVNHILSRVGNLEHKYLTGGNSEKKAVVLLTSNRGLAGGYNSNVAKLVTGHEGWTTENLEIYAVGNKGRDALYRKGYHIADSFPGLIDEPAYAGAMGLSSRLLEEFSENRVGEIYLAYTVFKNTVSHTPVLLRLLPVEYDKGTEENGEDARTFMNFEPKEAQALELIIPKYITSLLYGAMTEAAASENGARMQAMDNASGNAQDMINDLALKYNRARQGAITQELTEIIAGAEALG